jgi:hypothetical protein
MSAAIATKRRHRTAEKRDELAAFHSRAMVEVKLRWPLLPNLTSGHPLERIRELPPGVAYMPKPGKPLKVLIATEQALALQV